MAGALEVDEAVITEVADQLRRCGRGGPDPAHTAAMLVHAADAQLHRVLLDRGGDPEDLTRTLLAMTDPSTRHRSRGGAGV